MAVDGLQTDKNLDGERARRTHIIRSASATAGAVERRPLTCSDEGGEWRRGRRRPANEPPALDISDALKGTRSLTASILYKIPFRLRDDTWYVIAGDHTGWLQVI